jgi:hypothetical protein
MVIACDGWGLEIVCNHHSSGSGVAPEVDSPSPLVEGCDPARILVSAPQPNHTYHKPGFKHPELGAGDLTWKTTKNKQPTKKKPEAFIAEPTQVISYAAKSSICNDAHPLFDHIGTSYLHLGHACL